MTTFSIAINAKDGDGETITRWVRCVDWKGLTGQVGKGDLVKAVGRFRKHTYTKDGELRTVNELVLDSLTIERRKVRAEAQQAE